MNEYTGATGALIAGGRPGTARPITTFSLDNWGAATSRVLHRAGMPFKRGDIPKNFVPEIRLGETVVAAQFDERVTWKDGSLKFAVMHLRDTDLAAGASNTYEVWAVPGKYNNAGSLSVTAVSAANPLRCELSAIHTYAPTGNTLRGSGVALAKFDSHAAVATRVRKVHSGPVCEGWQVWGMFKEGINGQGEEDAHLKAVWYVDVWKDAAGAELAVEHCAVVTQDWWSSAGKTRLDYDLAYKIGTALVHNYAGVQHPYHSQWATVRMQDDHNHARRHWTTAQPTLLYKPAKLYWIESKLVPNYDTTMGPENIPLTRYPAIKTGVYVPCGAVDHRPDVNSPGAYMGRGMFPNYDVMAFLTPTEQNARVARANAFAGLGYPGHYRDQRSDGQDVSNKVIPLKCDPKPASYTQVPGLAPPMHAYRGGYFEPAYMEAPLWVEPVQGGARHGVWDINSYVGDMSHGVNYSAYGYLTEGERYMLEATIDLAMNTLHGVNANGGGSIPTVRWDNNAFARKEMQLSSPDRWAAISNVAGQERAMGLAMAIYSCAPALSPDGEPQTEYLRKWIAHQNDYLSTLLKSTPPGARRAGMTYTVDNATHSIWMHGFNLMGCYRCANMNELDSGFRRYAEMLTIPVNAQVWRNRYDTGIDGVHHLTKGTPYGADNRYVLPQDYFLPSRVDVVNGVLTTAANWYDFQDGDVVYFLQRSENFLLPRGVAPGTRFYAINSSVTPVISGGVNRSCEVASTPGGAKVDIPNGRYELAVRLYGGETGAPAVAAWPPYLPNPDSYFCILQGAVGMGEYEKSPHVVPGATARLKAFLANVDRKKYPAWAHALPA